MMLGADCSHMYWYVIMTFKKRNLACFKAGPSKAEGPGRDVSAVLRSHVISKDFKVKQGLQAVFGTQ